MKKLLFICCLLFISCFEYKQTSFVPLRKLSSNTVTTSKGTVSGIFFLFHGSYGSRTDVVISLSYLANNDTYVSIQVPYYKVRVQIDDTIEVPEISFYVSPGWSSQEEIDRIILNPFRYNNFEYVIIRCKSDHFYLDIDANSIVP